jgi:signal transduction histidine kinase
MARLGVVAAFRRRTGLLRLRVTLAAVAVVAVTLLVTGLMVTRWLRSSLLEDADRQLNNEVDFVAELAVRGELTPTLTATGVDTGQVQVLTADGRLVAVSPGLAVDAHLDVFPAPPVGGRTAHTVSGPIVGGSGTTSYRVVAVTVDTAVGPLTVYAASSLRAVDHAVEVLEASLWVGLPLLTVMAALGIWLVVGRSLSPVERMRREVAAIDGEGGGQRISEHARAGELDRLADTMNALLDRIDQAGAARRQFLADASHELRSPLASARAQLEVGLAYPTATDWPATATEVMVDLARLQSLAEELLDLARADGAERVARFERVDLGALAAREAARYTDDRLRVSTEPRDVSADPGLLVRVVRNLLDNALRHARTSAVMSVDGDANWIRLRVWNDGSAIPADERERIFEPFRRLDEARARDDGGAGLGLSITRRIVALHRGSIVAEPLDEGAAFTVLLPAAGAGPSPDDGPAGAHR